MVQEPGIVSILASTKRLSGWSKHRPGHEVSYYPGETNTRLAEVFVINKVDTADQANVVKVRENIRSVNPTAPF